MSNLSEYLAKNYLVADPKPAKKRKRKGAAASQGLIIADDDDDSTWAKKRATNANDEDGLPTIEGAVGGTSAEFRRTKKSNWKSVPGNTTLTGADGAIPKSADDTAAADAILASAAAETAAAQNADDELPAIEGGGASGAAPVQMSDGTHAGLQSAASVSAQLKKRREKEEADFAAERRARGANADQEEETVYRDATGRRVDVSMKRAEARRAAQEAEEREKERQAKIAPRGDVQAAEAKARREALQDAKTMAFARGADDEELNQELKEKERWNDPMAQFLGSGDGGGAQGAGGKKKKNKRPVYTGAAPPNRYGIRPGHRWDGVDRSNGFEGERFKAINRRERNKGLDYAWQMDE